MVAHKVGKLERLKMLYLLSVADAMATGPKAWNDLDCFVDAQSVSQNHECHANGRTGIPTRHSGNGRKEGTHSHRLEIPTGTRNQRTI